MNEQTQNSVETKTSTFLSLLKSELRGLWLAFWRPFWQVTIILAVLLWGYLLISQGLPKDASVPLYLLFGLFYCIYVCSFAGLFIGVISMAWRMAGIWIFFPIIVIPLSTFFTIWLFRSSLAEQAVRIVQVLQTVAQGHDWSQSLDMGPVARVGPGGEILFVLLLPIFAIDLIEVLFQPVMLGQYIRFIFLFAFAFALGFIPSAFISFIALSVSFVKRLKKRLKK